MYVWCGTVSRLLSKYIQLFQKLDLVKAIEQKKILLDVLDDGIDKMIEAQEYLGESSTKFNEAAGKLTTLQI